MGKTHYTRAEVLAALNRAADDVLVAIDAPAEGKRDVANVVVNTACHYLDDPGADLVEAIEAEYQEKAGTVLDWCRA